MIWDGRRSKPCCDSPVTRINQSPSISYLASNWSNGNPAGSDH